MPLYQIGPNRWTSRPPERPAARSSLPRPFVISDTMPETEQVDGSFHTSKRGFRAVGRALGLTEVGNEKPKPKTTRASATPAAKAARRQAIARSVERFKAGHRSA